MPATTRGRREQRPVTALQQEQGIESLRRPIPLGLPRETLPPCEEAARLLTLRRQVVKPANPYQRSFTLFRTRLCYTKDEAAGGVVRRMPDWPYLEEIDDALFTCPRLLMEKSRRVLASWTVCCFDLWLCAGGQDPRWPVLMSSAGNRQVILAAQKIEDIHGSDWFIRERIKFILDQFEVRDFRRFWPEFPHWSYRFGHMEFSNGSVIDAIPQGPHQARGVGATLVHAEELSHWEQAEPTINSILPTLRGGGHLCGICTPMARTYAHKIVLGRLRNRGN